MLPSLSRVFGTALKVDDHALGQSVAVEHRLKRVLLTDPALLVTTVGLTGCRPAALIDLNPAGLKSVRGSERDRDVAPPHEGREPVVGVVRHLHDIVLIP